MKVRGRPLVAGFIEAHPDSKASLETMVAMIECADWSNPMEVKSTFAKASLVGNGHVVFDICHNKYRADVLVNYSKRTALVSRIGTHKEYETWTFDDD